MVLVVVGGGVSLPDIAACAGVDTCDRSKVIAGAAAAILADLVIKLRRRWPCSFRMSFVSFIFFSLLKIRLFSLCLNLDSSFNANNNSPRKLVH